MEIMSIGYALLAVQSALLGVITPELRAVVVDFCKKKTTFVYPILLPRKNFRRPYRSLAVRN